MQNRKKNMIIFELPEAKERKPYDRKEDVNKFVKTYMHDQYEQWTQEGDRR